MATLQNHSSPPRRPAAQGAKQPGARPAGNRKIRWLTALLAIAVVGGLLLGYSLVQGRRFAIAFAQADYQVAKSSLDAAPWMRLGNGFSYGFAAAQVQMDKGDAAGALARLRQLQPENEQQTQLVQHGLYRAGGLLAEQQQIEQALAVMQQLGDYRDSALVANMLQRYQAAAKLDDAAEQYQAYNQLGNFLDSESKAEQAAKPLYEQAQQAFQKEDFWGALEGFRQLPGHQQADLYREACELWNTASANSSQNRPQYARLYELAQQAELGALLLSDPFFPLFLEGSWSSDEGGEFYMSATEYRFSALELPNEPYSFFGRGMRTAQGELTVSFRYVSADTIMIEIAATGRQYTFTRM